MDLILSHKVIGVGKPVILLHGLFGSSGNLMGIARSLQDHYQCILPDLVNHGKSFHADFMDYESMSQQLHSLLEFLELDSVAVIGHSMGGKLAMQFTDQYPSVIESLVVIDISPVAYAPRHNDILEMLSKADSQVFSSRDELRKFLGSHLDDDMLIEFFLKSFAKNKQGYFEMVYGLSGIFTSYNELSSAIDYEESLPVPALFLKGESSDYITQAGYEKIKTMFTQAQFKIVNGAGHWLHIDKPQACNRLIKQFLDKNYV